MSTATEVQPIDVANEVRATFNVSPIERRRGGFYVFNRIPGLVESRRRDRPVLLIYHRLP